MFPYEIYSNIPKRIAKNPDGTYKPKDIFEQDVRRYEEYEDLVLHNETPFIDIVKKYFKTTDRIFTIQNIVYSNDKGREVSNYVRRNFLNKNEEYEIGEYLISKTARK